MEREQFDILLVEDNQDEAELTIRALKKSKIRSSVVHIKNGEEALDFIFCQGRYDDRNIGYIPKLILLDLKMPRVDGIEILRRIKWDERTKIIPIVVLTSSKEEKDIMQSYQLGANSYFVKPVDFENFVDSIGTLTHYWLELNQTPKKL